jgi:uncharacterized membrane protein
MEALGPALILLSIPLMLRLVPPNRIYGFRVPSTLRNRSVWYDANARAGWQMSLMGLVMVLLELLLPLPVRNVVLSTIGVAGLLLVTAVNWRLANRWERERSAGAAAR